MKVNYQTSLKRKYSLTEQEVQEHLETEEQSVIDKYYFWVKSQKRYYPLQLDSLASDEEYNVWVKLKDSNY